MFIQILLLSTQIGLSLTGLLLKIFTMTLKNLI